MRSSRAKTGSSESAEPSRSRSGSPSGATPAAFAGRLPQSASRQRRSRPWLTKKSAVAFAIFYAVRSTSSLHVDATPRPPPTRALTAADAASRPAAARAPIVPGHAGRKMASHIKKSEEGARAGNCRSSKISMAWTAVRTLLLPAPSPIAARSMQLLLPRSRGTRAGSSPYQEPRRVARARTRTPPSRPMASETTPRICPRARRRPGGQRPCAP